MLFQIVARRYIHRLRTPMKFDKLSLKNSGEGRIWLPRLIMLSITFRSEYASTSLTRRTPEITASAGADHGGDACETESKQANQGHVRSLWSDVIVIG